MSMMMLGLDEIQPFPLQPAGRAQREIGELVEAQDRVKILRPPIVARFRGDWICVSGHRVLEAARRRGLGEVEVQVTEGEDFESLVNIFRAANVQLEVNPLEEAQMLRALVEDHGFPSGYAAHLLFIPQRKISAYFALTEAPEEIQKAVAEGELGFSVFQRELAALPGDIMRERGAEGWSRPAIRKAKRAAERERRENRSLDDPEPLLEELKEARRTVARAIDFLAGAEPEAARDISEALAGLRRALEWRKI